MNKDTGTWITPHWPAPGNVRAHATTRLGGVSRPPWASFNLAHHVGDDPRAVAENRAILTERLHLPAAPRWLDQTHGNTVIHHDGAPGAPPEPAAPERGDGCVATSANRVCAVLTADCLPVLLCDGAGANRLTIRPATRVGAAHAGWRGLAGGILEATVRAMDTAPAGLLAWLGPAIGPAAFEVGDEVRAAFIRDNPAAAAAFSPSVLSPAAEGRWLADLYALAWLRLTRLGVRAIYGGGFCTYSDAGRFFSYRRNGGRDGGRDGVTGRMASVIWMEDADGQRKKP